MLVDGVAECGRGALRAGSRQTQHEEEERAHATAKVADRNRWSPPATGYLQDTVFAACLAVRMSRDAG